MLAETKGIQVNINYFTKKEEAFHKIGSLTRFDGTLTTAEPNLVLEGNTLRIEGTKQQTFIGRFIFDDAGNLFFAGARKKNYFRITGKFESLLIVKVGA